jgi:hypothetical protein
MCPALTYPKMKAEGMLQPQRLLGLCLLLGAVIVGAFGWREFSSRRQPERAATPIIDKQPATITNQTFDPLNPPSEVASLSSGENAACDSKFESNASVIGETRETDATHGTVTVTQVKMTLHLNLIIWTPADVTQHVIEHENGHREISEYYYQNADNIAGRIAAMYIGKQVEISGADLNAESNKVLQQMATEITDEYNRELNPEPTQLLYDTITDHSRNEVVVQEAVAAALKNVAM